MDSPNTSTDADALRVIDSATLRENAMLRARLLAAHNLLEAIAQRADNLTARLIKSETDTRREFYGLDWYIRIATRETEWIASMARRPIGKIAENEHARP